MKMYQTKADGSLVEIPVCQVLPNNTTIYVGGPGASNVKDAGRGFAPDKPFAHLSVAMQAMRKCIVDGELRFILQADIVESSGINPPLFFARRIRIASDVDDTLREISIGANSFTLDGSHKLYFRVDDIFINFSIANGQGIMLTNGKFDISGCKVSSGAGSEVIGVYNSFASIDNTEIISANSSTGVASRHHSFTGIGAGCSFNGSFYDSVVTARAAGALECNKEIGGNPTGRRYRCMGGSSISTGGRGTEAIPGTIAGTCDANSTYN